MPDRTTRRLLLVTTALLAMPAHAAPDAPERQVADAEQAGDIIITARRRSENVQNVPIAVSVLSGETLDRQGAFNVSRLVQLQPSVQFISSNPRNTAVNIRGIGASFGLTNDGIEQGVGLYIDQVYYARIGSATLDFVDIERIEVLRGPQGTLYGKNTTAGAVAITTRRPGFTFEAQAEASIGNYGFVQAKGSISGPILADRVAARLSTSVTRRDGVLFNTVTDRAVNEIDNIGIRGQILWQASDRLDITLSADWNRQDPEGFAQTYVKVVPTLRAANRQFADLARLSDYAPASTDPFDRLVDNDAALRAKQSTFGGAILANWDLGPATLTSITAYRDWDWRPANDRDFTGLPITTLSANPSQQEQVSQEVRLSSNGSGRFQYVVGAFYFQQEINTQGVQEQGAAAGLWLLGPTVDAANPGLISGLRSSNDIRYRNESVAFYGKFTWNLSDKVSLAPGIRINHDSKRGRYDAVVTGGLPNPTPAQQALKNSVLQNQSYNADFSDWNLSGDLTLTWKPADNMLVYATHARAFKSGGINLSGLPTRADGATPATEVATVDPETVDHVEIGLKSTLLDGTATLNIAAFRTGIRDYQTTVVNNTVGVIRGYLANVPKVRSQGVELDFSARPVERLNAYVNFAWTDATYVDFPNAPLPVELSGGPAGSPQFVDASGGRLPGVSEYALSYGAEYRLPAGPGQAYVGIDGSFRSGFSSSPTPSRVLNVQGYALTNLRAGYRADGGWDVFGWVRNAFDTRYFDFLTAAPGSTGLVVGQLGDPRTYGLTASLRF